MRPRHPRSLSRRPVGLILAAALATGTLWSCGSPSATPSLSTSVAASATPSPTPARPSAETSPSAEMAPSASSQVSPLRDIAGNRLIGTAAELPQLDTDPAYAAILAREFDSVTPENSMKWVSVEPAQGQTNFSAADKIVAFAQAHGQKVRGHTLVWHKQLPAWLTDGTFTPTQLGDILKNHITLEAGRYAGKVYAWDVVNEVIADDGTPQVDLWSKGLGPGYIADAFRWARAADPAAKLYINDFDIEGINPKSDAVYNLVKSLRAQGVPIDGVGIQAHLLLQNPFPVGMADNIKRFTDLGVEVAITELDVRMPVPATAAKLVLQADYYRQVVAACTAAPKCVGITVWGYTDKYSWVPYSFPGEGAAALFDQNLAPKPAYNAVLAALTAGAH